MQYLWFNARKPVPVLIFALITALVLAGCTGKGQTVQLMPEAEAPMTCSEALETDTHGIPDDQFFHILNRSEGGDWLATCWTPLVTKALEEGREIPMSHLTRAIHRFNRRETKQAFNLAAFQYFSRMAKGRSASISFLSLHRHRPQSCDSVLSKSG